MYPTHPVAMNITTVPPSAAARVAPGKPRVWTTFVAWLVGLIAGGLAVIAAYIVVGFSVGLVMGFRGVDAATAQGTVQQAFQQPLVALLLALLPFQLGMGAVALLAARLSPTPLKERIGIVPPSGRPLSRGRVLLLACFTMSTALAVAIGSSMILGGQETNVIGAALNSGGAWTLTLLSIVLSILPAIVEEIVFRGYIQRRLLQRWSPMVAIGLSTLLFALIHADSLTHVLAVVPLGIVAGLLAFRTNSILPGMLLHAMHNAGVVAVVAAVRLLMPVIGEEMVGMAVIGAILVFGLGGLPAVIGLLRSDAAKEGVELSPQAAVLVEPLSSQAA